MCGGCVVRGEERYGCEEGDFKGMSRVGCEEVVVVDWLRPQYNIKKRSRCLFGVDF